MLPPASPMLFPRLLRVYPHLLRQSIPYPSFRAYPLLRHLSTSQPRIPESETYTKLKNRVLTNPYSELMRLDKPTGTNLLFLPAAWSITLIATLPEQLQLLPLFYIGATLLRGAGCTANDILDADIDALVTRTKSRPIPSGRLSQPRAIAFLTAQLSTGLLILTQLNTTAFLVGSLSVIPALFYPFAKRRLAHPQAVLAITFNTGALLGYAAVADTLALPAFLLHAAGFCWTMVYDTVYAHQDARDDRVIAIGSSALAFGRNTKPVVTAFVAGKAGLLTGTGVLCALGSPFFAGVAASSAYLLKVVWQTDLAKPQECAHAFRKCATAGGIVWAGIAAGRVFAA